VTTNEEICREDKGPTFSGGLLEASLEIVMRSKDFDFMTKILHRQGKVDHQALSTT
jgi:hypothetical protein